MGNIQIVTRDSVKNLLATNNLLSSTLDRKNAFLVYDLRDFAFVKKFFRGPSFCSACCVGSEN